MVWMVLRLTKSETEAPTFALDGSQLKKPRNTSNYNGLGDLPTQETKKFKLSADGRELSMSPIAS